MTTSVSIASSASTCSTPEETSRRGLACSTPEETSLRGLACSTPQVTSLRVKALVAAVILAAFSAYSLWVIAGHGYTGFLSLAGREPWAMQMLLDLVLACSFAIGWMRADARKHAMPSWPFFVATIFLGSVGLLAYVVCRGFVARARALRAMRSAA